METSGSPSDRFMGFAEGHFIVTTLGFALLLAGIGLGISFSPTAAAVLMLLYVPAGYGVSCMKKWSRPDGGTALKALLWPALVALAWALVGWILLTGLPETQGLGLALLLSTAFLASPSFCLMLFYLPLLTWAPGWYGAMALAAFLPSLLFFLGSLLPHRVKEVFHEKTDDTCPGSPAPGVPGGAGGEEPVQPGGDRPLRPLPPGGAGGHRGGLPGRGQDGGAV